jgi:hypothetical protein
VHLYSFFSWLEYDFHASVACKDCSLFCTVLPGGLVKLALLINPCFVKLLVVSCDYKLDTKCLQNFMVGVVNG